jgi:co-chaperonin GroES (HSP10)
MTDEDRAQWKVPDSFGQGSKRMLDIAPLRGRAVLRIEPEKLSNILVFPEHEGRKTTNLPHFARVVSLGPPALSKGGAEVPWGCKVGDRVLYVYGVALERVRRDGDLLVVAQEEIQAVVDEAT